MPLKFTFTEFNIPVPVYQNLRQQSGLSPKSTAAAEAGLKNSVYSILVWHEEKPVGMGRLIGDGGCFCQVVDICVLPQYQGQGIGKLVMQHITQFIDNRLPETCYISLLADGKADQLYAQFGFTDAMPASKGMYRKK